MSCECFLLRESAENRPMVTRVHECTDFLCVLISDWHYWWFVHHAALVHCNKPVCAPPCAPPVLQHSQSINQPGLGFTEPSSPSKSIHVGGDVHQSKCRSLASAITSQVPGTNKRYSSQTVHYACSAVHCLSFVWIGHVIFRPVFIYFIFSSCSAVQKVFFWSPVIDLRQCKEIVCSRNKTRIRTDLDVPVVHNKKKTLLL